MNNKSDAALAALRQYFGHSGFRPGQQALIEALLSGRDVLGVMPTGAGKSACYQIPAVLLPGLTLVLSPLISLMKDQVAALAEAGIPAGYINSSLDAAEYALVCRQASAGQLRLLYVAPERLDAPGFQQLIAALPISLVAVDEAHCVSQWGQDFRPGYLRIAAFLDSLPARPPVGAFTATATRQVSEDIRRLLELRDPLCITTGFDRPNLFFEVARPRDKMAWLRRFLADRPGQSGIVYCATRKTVESVCAGLREAGIAATRYHAGLSDAERRQNQEDFVYDRARVMAATNAFGMGIDKSNVSFVVHYNMPRDLESYYQEAGRAGRDGSPAHCALLFSAGDVQTARYMIDHPAENDALPPDEQQRLRRRDLERLARMTGYCKAPGCLRAVLLRYFGEDAPEECGNCSGCCRPKTRREITTEAQKILSAVVRIERRYRSGLGAALVIQMLRGSRQQRVLQLGLDRLPTYGILKEASADALRGWIDHLIAEGYLYQDGVEYPVLRAAPKARRVLFEGEQVFCLCDTPAADDAPDDAPGTGAPAAGRKQSRAGRGSKPGSQPLRPEDESLFGALRALRAKLAEQGDVPAYVVFSNATLIEMAALRPASTEELLQVSGVGEVKAARYGEAFLAAIRDWQAAQQTQTEAAEPPEPEP